MHNTLHIRPYDSKLIWLILPVLLVLPVRTSAATSVAYTKTRVLGVPVNIVTTDLNNPNIVVTPAIARRGIGTYETFSSLAKRTGATAATSGTYFCTRSFLPTGDIVIDGRLIWSGHLGTAVTIKDHNKVSFIPTRLKDIYNWYNYDAVLAAGPTLLLRGDLVVYPKAEGFTSRTHLAATYRGAVGLTKYNKLLFVTSRAKVQMGKMARIMRALNCVDAVALDSGSSAALYWKGSMITRPTRAMTNCLLVYDNVERYNRYRATLFPDGKYLEAAQVKQQAAVPITSAP